MVTVVAPTTPLAAASSTPTITTAMPSPPGSAPNRRPMVSSRSSAMRERSSITPMKMNSGIASSTSLVITPIDALRQRAEEPEAHRAGELAEHREGERHAAERERHRIAGEQQGADRDHHQDGEDFGQRPSAFPGALAPLRCPHEHERGADRLRDALQPSSSANSGISVLSRNTNGRPLVSRERSRIAQERAT